MIRKVHFMTTREILLEAGSILKKRYFEKQTYSVKERFHLLSQIDLAMDELISRKLQKSYPKHSIFSEESDEIQKSSQKRWILDPIDGTTNLIMGNPSFAISLALEDRGKIVEGHVYNPVTDEYYFAPEDDNSSFLNGEPLTASETSTISEALIAFGYSAKMSVIHNYYSHWRSIFENCRKGIGWVAPALSICNVARGRVDAFIDTGCSMEGQAAASLILSRAQGKMFDNGFKPYDHSTKGAIFCSAALEDDLRKAYQAP